MSSSSTVNLKSDEFTFDILNQEIITPEESSRSEFGLVSTDSLLNPSQESSYIDSKSYDASPFLDFIGQDTGDQYQLRHFIDDWPNDTSEHSAIAWPAELKSDWTKLSMSIPMTSSDFSSSSNSSKHKDNLVLSPLRLSREFEPTLMSLAGSDYLAQIAQNEIKWVPTSWAAASDCSVGGPLGEALTNSSGYEKAYKNYPPSSSSSLNLLTDGCDGSPQVGSSPTGVLQKSTFCSLSNSSSESSPRGEYKRRNYIVGASIYDDVLGTPLASTSVPSL